MRPRASPVTDTPRRATGNPYLNRLAARASNEHGKISESKVAKKLGARLTPNSGAKRGAKSDATLDGPTYRWQIESKSTVKNTLGIELGWLVKVQNEALNTGRMPALTISFVTAEGKPRKDGEWVACPLHVWRELTEK